jgi:hypothetical protein
MSELKLRPPETVYEMAPSMFARKFAARPGGAARERSFALSPFRGVPVGRGGTASHLIACGSSPDTAFESKKSCNNRGDLFI